METYKRIGRSVGLILAYFGIMLGLSVILSILDISNDNINTIAMIFVTLFSTGFVVYRLRDELKGKLKDFKNNFWEKILPSSFKCWIMGYLSLIVANFIIISIVGNIAPNQAANEELMDSFFVYSIVATCICAPIAEELLFRLNFRRIFKNERTFLIVTSLLFGAMHLVGTTERIQDVLFIIPYSILGYAFGTAYLKNDNIFASIFIHMLHNTIAVLLMIFLV